MPRVERYIYDDEDISLVYPECPYYKEHVESTNDGLINGFCCHPDKGAYQFCSTYHLEHECCPFNIKEELQ